MEEFRNKGEFIIKNKILETTQTIFYGARIDDENTKKTIQEVYETTGELVDPHTAVGIAAGRSQRRNMDVPMIALATAHPAKFPKAVMDATGQRPDMPDRLAKMMDGEEQFDVLANDLDLVRTFISDNAKIIK